MTAKQEDIYQSIEAACHGLYKEKGSKFLAFAFPVSNEDQIKDHLAQLRKSYFDARHHCYAWALGKDIQRFRANDDGEPNHSAGDPILGQIRSHNLSDLLIVVIRYFGGTKLGVSGLIHAYKTAAAEALSTATMVEKIVSEEWKITFPYEKMNEVMKLCKDYDLPILDQKFYLECEIKVRVRLSAIILIDMALQNWTEVNKSKLS